MWNMFAEYEEAKELIQKGICIDWETALEHRKGNGFNILKRCIEKLAHMPVTRQEKEKAAEFIISDAILTQEEASQVLENILRITKSIPCFKDIEIDKAQMGLRDKISEDKRQELMPHARKLKKVIAKLGPYTSTKTKRKLYDIARVMEVLTTSQKELDDTTKKLQDTYDPNKTMDAIFHMVGSALKTGNVNPQLLATMVERIDSLVEKVGIFSGDDLISAISEQQFLLKCIEAIDVCIYKKGHHV